MSPSSWPITNVLSGLDKIVQSKYECQQENAVKQDYPNPQSLNAMYAPEMFARVDICCYIFLLNAGRS